MIIKKQDESYTLLISENSSDIETLQKIHDFLKSEKPDAKYNFKVQKGWESPYTYFTEVKKIKETGQSVMKIMNGHLQLLTNYNLHFEQELSEFTEQEIDAGLADIIKMMPFEPYDFQLKCARDNLMYNRQISLACTGCLDGKSDIEVYVHADDINYIENILGRKVNFTIEESRLQEICSTYNINFNIILKLINFLKKTYNISLKQVNNLITKLGENNICDIYDMLIIKDKIIKLSKLSQKVMSYERYEIYYSYKAKKIYTDYCKSKTEKWKPKSYDTVSLKYHIQKYGDIEGLAKYKERVYNCGKPTRIEYYLDQGYSEEDSKKLLSERQRTFTLEKCITRYGEIEGKRIFNERQVNWQNTLKSKSQEEIDDINKLKGITLDNMIRKWGEEDGNLRYKKWKKSLSQNNSFSEIQFLDNNSDAMLYYIHFYNDEIEFWKIGITTKLITERFNFNKIYQNYNLNHEILFLHNDTAHNVFVKEQYILKSFDNNRITIDYNGFFTTEAFNKNILQEYII